MFLQECPEAPKAKKPPAIVLSANPALAKARAPGKAPSKKAKKRVRDSKALEEGHSGEHTLGICFLLCASSSVKVGLRAWQLPRLRALLNSIGRQSHELLRHAKRKAQKSVASSPQSMRFLSSVKTKAHHFSRVPGAVTVQTQCLGCNQACGPF